MFGLEAIWRDGQVVGHIRRADFGFAIDKTIAYGYIRDPAGGPVSTGGSAACPCTPGLAGEAQSFCSKPYARAHCHQMGCETGHPLYPPKQCETRGRAMPRLGGGDVLAGDIPAATPPGPRVLSDANCKRVFNCSGELSYFTRIDCPVGEQRALN